MTVERNIHHRKWKSDRIFIFPPTGWLGKRRDILRKKVEDCMPGSKWRDVTEQELALIHALLPLNVHKSSDLLQTCKSTPVRTIEEYADTYGSLEFQRIDGDDAAADFVVAAARATDADGVPIDILLHMADQWPTELEIVKLDGSKIVAMPAGSEFRLYLVDIR